MATDWRCFARLLAVCMATDGWAGEPHSNSAPMVTYGDKYWANVDCAQAAEAVKEVCLRAHAKAANVDPNTVAVPKHIPSPDEAETAVDLMLSGWLKDPMSAMQYRLGSLVDCSTVIDGYALSPKQAGCICYSVNSKNSFGGYVGASLAVVVIEPFGDAGWIARPVSTQLMTAGCGAQSLAPRDANLIKANVR